MLNDSESPHPVGGATHCRSLRSSEVNTLTHSCLLVTLVVVSPNSVDRLVRAVTSVCSPHIECTNAEVASKQRLQITSTTSVVFIIL